MLVGKHAHVIQMRGDLFVRTRSRRERLSALVQRKPPESWFGVVVGPRTPGPIERRKRTLEDAVLRQGRPALAGKRRGLRGGLSPCPYRKL